MEAVASPPQQRWQKRILALCRVSYALSYLCRTNLSCIAGNDGAAALVGGWESTIAVWLALCVLGALAVALGARSRTEST